MRPQSFPLSGNTLGLRASRLLLPLDLAKCPPEIFPLANGFSPLFGGQIVLLHVVEPRTDRARVDGRDLDLRRAQRHLERLGHDYLRTTIETSARVRLGTPHEEIFAEAEAIRADLILLPTFTPPLWRRFAGPGCGGTTRGLATGAPCFLFVVNVRKRFNCFRQWTGEESFQ